MSGKISAKMKRLIEDIFVYAGLSLVVVLAVLPILFALLTSLKNPVDAFSIPPKWIFVPTLKFHYIVWLEKPFLKYLINTLIISGGTVAVSLTIGVPAAYFFARYRNRWVVVLLLTFLAIRMFPHMLLVIPYYLLARSLNLYDTYLLMILIIAAFNQPFTLWLMRGFFLSVPREMDEAAMVDGCSTFTAFLRVVLPVVRPGLAATALFSFLLAYNQFLFPLILTGRNTKTLPVAIAEYGAESIEYWSISAAGMVGIIAPIIVIIILLQKHLVEGLTFGLK